MEVRISRENSREMGKGSSMTLQKKIVEARRTRKPEPVPDLTDFMNDMFFGTVNDDNKQAYNLTGSGADDEEEPSFDDSTRSNSSRLTQEWLEEARRMVAQSPGRCESPVKRTGSPRFAAAAGVPGRLSSASILDRRDPLSRSARSQRSLDGFSGEILSKSAKHTRNRSESLDTSRPNSPSETSPVTQVHRWFSNILKPSQPIDPPDPVSPRQPLFDSTAPTLPPRQSIHRKSRFQTAESPASTASQPIPVLSRRTFKPAPLPANTQLLSPPKTLVESPHRLSISSSTCSQPLSPPRNLVESAHRRSIAKSTCSSEKIAPRPNAANGWHKEEGGDRDTSLNAFLDKQRSKMDKILNREVSSKAKVILSGPSNSTSSMVATICYAWLLENRLMKNNNNNNKKEESNGDEYVVVPVMNVRRGRMWKQRQAAWLFHHVGLDVASLFFADEVDFESLMMARQLNILVVGQDVLKNNSEVGSQCTTLTDNYCEDAYDLLQTPVLKGLLLAGILLDTQNLSASSKQSTARDAEAVQLLLVGSTPNYGNTLYDQMLQDQRDNSFFEALRNNYGKPPSENSSDSVAPMENRKSERKSSSSSRSALTPSSDKNSKDAKNGKTEKDTAKSAKPNAPTPEKPAPDASRGKNKFFLAKWFGFGSK